MASLITSKRREVRSRPPRWPWHVLDLEATRVALMFPGGGAYANLNGRGQSRVLNTANWSKVGDFLVPNSSTVELQVGTEGTDLTLSTKHATVVWIAQRPTNTGTGRQSWGAAGGTTNALGAHWPWTDNNGYADFGGLTAPNRLTIASLFSQYDPRLRSVHVFRWGPAGAYVWVNGKLIGSSGTAVTARTTAGGIFGLGRKSSTGDNGSWQTEAFFYLDDERADAAELSVQPYARLVEEYRIRRYFLPGASDTGVTGTADISEAPDTATGAGTVGIPALATATEAADTAVAAGTVAIPGAGTATEAPDTAVGAGDVNQAGDTGVDASADITESPDTAVGAGTVGIPASGVVVEADDYVSGSGSVGDTASSARRGGGIGKGRKRRFVFEGRTYYARTVYEERQIVSDLLAHARAVVEVATSSPERRNAARVLIRRAENRIARIDASLRDDDEEAITLLLAAMFEV